MWVKLGIDQKILLLQKEKCLVAKRNMRSCFHGRVAVSEL